jgi:hypothetical protein
VVTELAGLLDRFAELDSDQAIQALLPRAGADHWAAFAGWNRRGQWGAFSGGLDAVAWLVDSNG